jgi:CRP-like cAMP-binding protein
MSAVKTALQSVRSRLKSCLFAPLDLDSYPRREGSEERESPSMSFSVSDLPRGGRLIQWDDFVLQLGAYPETIKDTISGGVPGLFLVADQLFDVSQGVSSAELEFPVYFNFYVKSRKTRFICRPNQLRPIWRVLREAVFGPDQLHETDFVDGVDTPGYPDMLREMAWFKADPKRPKGRLQLRDLATPLLFDDELKIEVDGVTIRALGHNQFSFTRGGESHQVNFRSAPTPSIHEPTEFYRPPTFGVTIIGSGHGFDAATATSGFLIWINGKGVLVDPPVHSTRWLKEQQIDTRICQDVILTHCHADHDSGTLQKVLEESRVTLHSTDTVLASFIRKYGSLTGLNRSQFCRLFDFRPVIIGDSITIAGGEFTFHYTFHPIPTLGFSVTFQGKTFAYSCDNLYHPETFRQLEQEGVFTPGRHRSLLDFRWNADLILHEAGVPPIHTPMNVLAGMNDEIKSRMWLTHVSQAAIPADSGLRLAPPGAANTLVLDVPLPAESALAHRILDLMAHVDLFSDMHISHAVEFLEIAHYQKHSPGAVVVRQNEVGDRFFMVLGGELDIVVDGEFRKILGRYDYFGEIAVVLNQRRVADVVARTEVELLWISRRDFLQFTRGTEVLATLRRVSEHKIQGAWNVFANNRLLRSLSTYQRTQLLALMTPVAFHAEEWLFREGESAHHFYMIERGEVQVGADPADRIGPGTLVGQIFDEGSAFDAIHHSQARALTEVRAFAISAGEIQRFTAGNPGTTVRWLGATGQGSRCYVR